MSKAIKLPGFAIVTPAIVPALITAIAGVIMTSMQLFSVRKSWWRGRRVEHYTALFTAVDHSLHLEDAT